MRQQRKAQILPHRIRRVSHGRPHPGPAVFAGGPGNNINQCVKACAKHQMIIQGRAQVQDHHDQRPADDRVHHRHDVPPLFPVYQIGKYRGEGHAKQHEIHDLHREQAVDPEAGPRHCQKQQNRRCNLPAFVMHEAQNQAADEAARRSDENRKQHHDDHRSYRNLLRGRGHRHKGHHQKKDYGSHHIVQHRHGNQRLCHRSGGSEFIDDRQGRGRRCRQGDSAEQQGKIKRNACEPEHNSKDQADHKKGPQRFRDGHDQKGASRPFHIPQNQFCADHHTRGAFHQPLHRLIPAGIHHAAA